MCRRVPLPVAASGGTQATAPGARFDAGRGGRRTSGAARDAYARLLKHLAQLYPAPAPEPPENTAAPETSAVPATPKTPAVPATPAAPAAEPAPSRTAPVPAPYAARHFDARKQGAGDQQLRQFAAEALKEVYFQDSGRRAGSLEEVRFTDIEHLEFGL